MLNERGILNGKLLMLNEAILIGKFQMLNEERKLIHHLQFTIYNLQLMNVYN